MHDEKTARIRRLWFPNVEEFLSKNDFEYAAIVKTKIIHLAHRFLSCLKPGDVLITPQALDEDFCAYYRRILNLGMPSEWLIKVTPCHHPYSLGKSVLNDAVALKHIKKTVSDGNWIMEPYMQSEDAMDLSEAIAIPFMKTSPALLRAGLIVDFNDKAWFKNHANRLGIRAVPGYVADSETSLRDVIVRASKEFGDDVMLRKAVHGGGLGNLRGDRERLLSRLPTWYSKGKVLVEPYLHVRSVAGSLSYISEKGIAYLGTDRQTFDEGKWCGFDFPYPAGKALDYIREQTVRISESAYQMGARGHMNLDWAFTEEAPESPLILECNFRHNGFNFLLDFATQYFDVIASDLFIRYRELIPCALNNTARLIDGLFHIRMNGEPVLIDRPGVKEGVLLVMPPSENRYSVAVFSPEKAYINEVISKLSQCGF
jgi:hypothetical protein